MEDCLKSLIQETPPGPKQDELLFRLGMMYYEQSRWENLPQKADLQQKALAIFTILHEKGPSCLRAADAATMVTLLQSELFGSVDVD